MSFEKVTWSDSWATTGAGSDRATAENASAIPKTDFHSMARWGIVCTP